MRKCCQEKHSNSGISGLRQTYFPLSQSFIYFLFQQGQLSNRLRSSSMTDGVSDQAQAPPLMVRTPEPIQTPPSWLLLPFLSVICSPASARDYLFCFETPWSRGIFVWFSFSLLASTACYVNFCLSLHVRFAAVFARHLLHCLYPPFSLLSLPSWFPLTIPLPSSSLLPPLSSFCDSLAAVSVVAPCRRSREWAERWRVRLMICAASDQMLARKVLNHSVRGDSAGRTVTKCESDVCLVAESQWWD